MTLAFRSPYNYPPEAWECAADWSKTTEAPQKVKDIAPWLQPYRSLPRMASRALRRMFGEPIRKAECRNFSYKVRDIMFEMQNGNFAHIKYQEQCRKC